MNPPLSSGVRNLVATVCALFLLAAFPAMAQQYPTRPITALWPYPAGSASDSAMRIVLQAVGEALGQPIVLENRPGSAGRNVLIAMATARKDGYLVGLGSTADMIQKGIADPRLR